MIKQLMNKIKCLGLNTEVNNIKNKSSEIYENLDNLKKDTVNISKKVKNILEELRVYNHANYYSEAISNATNCLIWHMNAENVIISLNDNMKNTMGYFRNVKGLTAKEIIRLYKNNFSDTKVIEDLLSEENTKENVITKISRGKFFNKEIVLRIRKCNVHDSTGTVIGKCGIADDITSIVNGIEFYIKNSKDFKETNDLNEILNLFLDNENDNIRR